MSFYIQVMCAVFFYPSIISDNLSYHCSIFNVPDEGHFRNGSCAINLLSTFCLYTVVLFVCGHVMYMTFSISVIEMM